MKLGDFDFDLPTELIATRPANPRSSARLLHANGDAISDRVVTDLPDILRPDDLLVLNNTKVLPARLFGSRQRGAANAKIEITLLSPNQDGQWEALVKPLRKLEPGEVVTFAMGLEARLEEKREGHGVFSFNLVGEAFDQALENAGTMPLPPYIAGKRPADDQDKIDYQTVFAEHAGAVAAPTASLHFDDPLLQRLREKGIEFAHVTLHVGAGTFLPVKVDDVKQHKMHAEYGRVSAKAAETISQAKKSQRRVIPVGTTALRLIEAAAVGDGQIDRWQGETDIFIYPGHDFKIADGLMTNFHLPKSTLMMLVAAMMGKVRIDRIYAHAIAEKYRFFSYGDSSLLLP